MTPVDLAAASWQDSGALEERRTEERRAMVRRSK